MDKIKKIFDDFTFHARIMPVFVTIIPIIMYGLFKGIVNESMVKETIYLSMITAFLAFGGKCSREQGKKIEEKMYVKLKAKPTTIIMRYTNKTIDEITKTRYHQKLNDKIEGIKLPLKKQDETYEADKHYESAITWLRNYANSNRDKEPRVYQELKEYNFWRNLCGIKYIAVGVYILIGIREYLTIEQFSWSDVFMKPYPQYLAFITMILSIILIFLVNKKTVEKKAFDYAKTLAEVCERI